jgi:hypothetical protein
VDRLAGWRLDRAWSCNRRERKYNFQVRRSALGKSLCADVRASPLARDKCAGVLDITCTLQSNVKEHVYVDTFTFLKHLYILHVNNDRKLGNGKGFFQSTCKAPAKIARI